MGDGGASVPEGGGEAGLHPAKAITPAKSSRDAWRNHRAGGTQFEWHGQPAQCCLLKKIRAQKGQKWDNFASQLIDYQHA